MRRKKPKLLRPIHPNCGIEAAYRKKLRALVEEMHASVEYWLTAAYRANEPEITSLASDEMPASALRVSLRRLARRWTRTIEQAAGKLAKWFAQSVADRSDAVLKKALKDSGFAVEFKLTRAQRDVLAATVEQNVSLIRSIPQRYFTEIEGLVMRSVQQGGDLKTLSSELRDRYNVTKKRAAFISRDQNSKANSALTRVRRLELGLKEAIWLHSAGGKVPRPHHVKMSGQKFDMAKGMWDVVEKRFVQPGELISCRCVSRPVVPGFT